MTPTEYPATLAGAIVEAIANGFEVQFQAVARTRGSDPPAVLRIAVVGVLQNGFDRVVDPKLYAADAVLGAAIDDGAALGADIRAAVQRLREGIAAQRRAVSNARGRGRR